MKAESPRHHAHILDSTVPKYSPEKGIMLTDRWMEACLVRVLTMFEHILLSVFKAIVFIVTFPYYRSFQFYTLKPILRIAACTVQPGGDEKVLRLLILWRTRKLAELHFISIAVSNLSHCASDRMHEDNHLPADRSHSVHSPQYLPPQSSDPSLGTQ